MAELGTTHTRRSRVGRTQRRRTPTGAARTPDLRKFYRYKLPPITPGDFLFRLRVLPGRGGDPWELDTATTSFTWSDDPQSGFTGNLQLQRFDVGDPDAVPIGRLMRVECAVRWDHEWYVLWTLRAKPPEEQDDTGVLSVDLEDDLDLLQRDQRHWAFRRTKRRRHGFTCDEIARQVARKCGVRIAHLAKGKHRIDKLEHVGSGADVVQMAYDQERQATGRKFVIRMINGRLSVQPYRRNDLLYVFADQIQTAMRQQQPHNDSPATVITGHAQLGKGKDAHKISYTLHRRAVVRRYGYVEQEKDYGQVKSHAELRRKVTRELADALKVDVTGTVEHAGIPFIRRGDTCALDLPRGHFTGRKGFVFTTAVRHTVNPGSYTTAFDFTTVDPYVKDKSRRTREARAKTRQARARRRTKH